MRVCKVKMVVLLYWFLLLLLTRQGLSQCFTSSDCTGDEVVSLDKPDCCVGTDDGLAFNDGSSCSLCIGLSLDFVVLVLIIAIMIKRSA